MNLGSVYKSVNFLLNKDVSGYSFTPEQFSLVCQMVQLGIYNDAIKAKFRPFVNQKADVDPNEYTVLEQLLKTSTLTTPFDCPSDFMHEEAVTIDNLDAEILDVKRYNKLVRNPFFESAQPPVKIEQKKVVTNIVPLSMIMEYYRTPLDCYYDYVIDVNGVVVYMEPKSSLLTNGANLDLVRARTAYANSTGYAVGDRVTYSGLAYEVNTIVLNTNTTPPTSNSSFTSVGNIVISATVTHLLPAGTNGYVSASVELDIPAYFYNEFVKAVVEWAITNLKQGVTQ